MSRIRIAVFALISLIASLLGTLLSPGTFLNRAFALALCSLLSLSPTLCTANLKIGAQSAVAQITPKAPILIGDIPRIRDAELDIPDDFVVVRQTPLNSGRRQIVLVSSSTGMEQIYTTSLPDAGKNEIYEAEYKNTSKIDKRPLSTKAKVDDEELEGLLKDFKVVYEKNTPSKVILSDKSSTDFNDNQVTVKSKTGQEIEKIILSKLSLDNKAILVSQADTNTKSLDKVNSALLAQSTPACETNTYSELITIQELMKRRGDELIASGKQDLTRIVGAALIFTSQALRENITIGENKLQVVICKPPVKCDEQVVAGGSEIRTDIFQLSQGVSKKEVVLEYEFFTVPDKLEMFYDGKKIFEVGPTSGSGKKTFTLPLTAQQVGVTVTGNQEQKSTEWRYKISCSGKPQKTKHLK
jgi:hypothetical protein